MKRAARKSLDKPTARVDRARLVTEFRDGKGRLCVARDCTHCGGKMATCPECGGVGVTIHRVTGTRQARRGRE